MTQDIFIIIPNGRSKRHFTMLSIQQRPDLTDERNKAADKPSGHPDNSAPLREMIAYRNEVIKTQKELLVKNNAVVSEQERRLKLLEEELKDLEFIHENNIALSEQVAKQKRTIEKFHQQNECFKGRIKELNEQLQEYLYKYQCAITQIQSLRRKLKKQNSKRNENERTAH